MAENDRTGLERANNPLKEKLLRWMPETGQYPTAVESLMISRRDRATQNECSIYKPLVAVIVQGYKRSIIGAEEYSYGKNYCLVAGVDMPSVNYVTVASPEEPFLAREYKRLFGEPPHRHVSRLK